MTVLAGLAAATILLPSPASAETTRDQIIGTWQLTSFTATTGDRVSHPLGERPGGLVGFTPTRAWVVLVDSTRPTPASAALSDAEAVALMRTGSAYTGRYEVDPAQTPDGIKVSIHVDAAMNQAFTGTTRVFFLRVDGNRLIVTSPAAVPSSTGQPSKVRLEFNRVE